MDTALYDHFEKKLDLAVEKYGRSRMAGEVSRLRTQLREVEEKCVDVRFYFRKTIMVISIRLMHNND